MEVLKDLYHSLPLWLIEFILLTAFIGFEISFILGFSWLFLKISNIIETYFKK